MSIADTFRESSRILESAAERIAEPLEAAVGICRECLERGGKLLVLGNGGSAADAQHFAAELVGRVRREREPLAAVALTTDTSALTAIGNDYGFERLFSRQVEALARAGDVLLAISTSGKSPNVVAAARAGRRRGCRVIALTGQDGGDLAGAVDVWIAAPTTVVTRVQEVHSVCVHVLAEGIEDALGIVADDDPED